MSAGGTVGDVGGAPAGRGPGVPDDDALARRHGEALVEAFERALPGWLTRVIDDRIRAAGGDPTRVAGRRDAVVESTVTDLVAALRAELTRDVDEQTTTPLSLVRRAVTGPPTALLDELGVAPAGRDAVDERLHPADVHALGPATFADLGPEVAEAAIVWGAAKAHVHLRRHGARRSASLSSPPVPDPDTPDPAAAALAAVSGIEGWLTEDQARRLFRRAADVAPGGRIVEIGSFRGRSTIVLASAAADGVEVVAIDPHGGGDRGPGEITPDPERGDADHDAFVANLRRAGVDRRVRHVRSPSADAHPHVEGPIDLLYVDGAHRFGPARHDLTAWGDRVRPGGTMVVHDAFSSVGVTLALFTTTAVSRRWRYRGRVGSLAEFERTGVTGARWLGDLGVHLLQVPWFVRNLAVKVLLTLRLRPLTRLLGHRTGDWPY